MSESEGGDRSENERQLVALLKSAQEEREELLLKQVRSEKKLIIWFSGLFLRLKTKLIIGGKKKQFTVSFS